MKIREFRIPKAIVLPGLVVKVVQVPPSDIPDCDGEWEYDTEGLAIIRLNKSLPMPVKRYTLIHELQHVMVDYLGQALNNYKRIIRPAR